MASNRPAPEGPSADEPGDRGAFLGPGEPDGNGDGPWEEWNPTEESVRSVRGKHRVAKQRAGGLTRGGTVLGVGVIAAVGASGMASAEDRPPLTISMPDVGGMADDLSDALPDAASLPGVGGLISDASDTSDADAAPASGSPVAAVSGPLSQATGAAADDGVAGPGEALRSRILQQADAQQGAGEQEARTTAEHTALRRADKEATAHQQSAEKAAAAKKAAEMEAERQAEEAARQKAEAARLAKLAQSFTAPVVSFTLTAGFGESGDRWAADHTGQDFAAPSGTPVKAIHAGTITQAGWAGAYGYRIVLRLDDGTELWFCHLSSMVKTSGKVGTGEVIARVGATGNVTGPHLHLEVRPGGGDPIDPMPWLREHGIKV